MFACRIQASSDWIESQIPEIVKVGILRLEEGLMDGDEYDVDALVQAYVNVVAGACISLGTPSIFCSLLML